MFENIFGKIEEKSSGMEAAEKTENPKRRETAENEAEKEKITREFADELRKPYKGSYLKKLERVAVAFILAGITVFATPDTSIAPEISKDLAALMRLKNMDYFSSDYEQTNKIIVKSLKEKGGIIASPQLPETVYKPHSLSYKTRAVAFKDKDPYFLNPKVVLGEKFIKNNPEKTAEYMKKIKETINSTVRIETDINQGSGVIINTNKGKIIITNEHVVGEKSEVFLNYHNNESAYADVVDVDKEKDLAILKLSGGDQNGEYVKKFKEKNKGKEFSLNDFLEGIMPNGLDIAGDDFLEKARYGEKLAIVGNPLGFPFEVSIAEFSRIEKFNDGFINDKEKPNLRKFSAILSVPDSRFTDLALYDSELDFSDPFTFAPKGASAGGMSGGPIIILEKGDKPAVVGINTFARRTNSGKIINGGVSLKDIKEFLAKNGY